MRDGSGNGNQSSKMSKEREIQLLTQSLGNLSNAGNRNLNAYRLVGEGAQSQSIDTLNSRQKDPRHFSTLQESEI